MDANNHGPLVPRPDWLALRCETAIERDLPIVDPHHHLWDRPRQRYLLAELLDDLTGGHNVRSTVFVECKSMYRCDGDPDFRSVGEIEFAAGVAAMSESGIYGQARVCEAIVGNANLLLGDGVRAVLEAQLAASGGRLRGIRNISAWHSNAAARASASRPPPQLLLDPSFRNGFRQLASLGLAFDAFLYHTQLGELRDLAMAYPDTTIVLDHAGGPLAIGPYAQLRDETFAHWSTLMRMVGQCPNVVVKIGGFGMRLFGFGFHDAEIPPSSEHLARTWKPYVDTCVDAFGTHRCMFESNFPVDKASCSYTVLWNAFKRLTAGWSTDERRQVFCDVAVRTYRLRPVDAPSCI
jgi:predicted TIM-barrel fold metal-dependent hydrolase